jgi:hypothetical protein
MQKRGGPWGVRSVRLAYDSAVKVPILCYHSCNAGNDYATDDHSALAADLRAIYRLGFRVVPLDGVDADHPTYGPRRSFANIIRDFTDDAGAPKRADRACCCVRTVLSPRRRQTTIGA